MPHLPNGRPAPQLDGDQNRNLRVTNGPSNGAKVDPNDPQVRKLVYNMYRGMLGQRHQQANEIVDSAPKDKVEIDVGVGPRVESMMRQQAQLKGSGMNTTGTLPPPPPPPIPSVLPSSRLPTEIPARPTPVMNPPAALAGAMMKDKKPFTYTPGGIDLSEINSPQPNGAEQGDPQAPVQSRSFRVLQTVLSNQDSSDGPCNVIPTKVEVPCSPSIQKRTTLTNTHCQRGSISNPQSNSHRGPVSLANIRQRIPVKSGTDQQQQQIYRVIPIQQDVKVTPKMEGFKTNNFNGSELSSIFRNQVRVSTDNDEARSRGGYFPPRTVAVTQNCEPQGPVHIPNIRQQQKPTSPQQSQQYQQSGHFQHHTIPYQHPGGMTSSTPTEDAPPEPKKYMGGSIPSRSFKMLQALTNSDDASDQGVAASGSNESSQHPHPPLDSDTQHAGSHIPSPPSWKSMHTSPPSLSPSSIQTNTCDSSSDSGIFSSKVSPSYTTTEDSKVYRNVTPKVTINKSKQEHVVNPALSKNSASSPTWKNSHTPKFSTHATPVMVKPLESNGQEQDQDSPSLMKIVRQESTNSQHSQEGTERRYEGAHIPSRVFRQLQTEYSDSGTDIQDLKLHQGNSHDTKPHVSSNVHAPHFHVKGVPLRVVKSLQSSGFEPDQSNSIGDNQDDYYCNGMSTAAAHKDTVLKELTSQFDHIGTRKKPRAAPGRVFRHLQMQYDTPDQDEHPELLSEQPEDAQGFGNRGFNLPSPSFRSLQNQYHHPERPEEVHYVDEQSHDAPEYEHEPLPYQGARIPGRTFRSLQDNIGAHPSVLKPRK